MVWNVTCAGVGERMSLIMSGVRYGTLPPLVRKRHMGVGNLWPSTCKSPCRAWLCWWTISKSMCKSEESATKEMRTSEVEHVADPP